MRNDNELIMRLAKLRESIEKKESELASIRKVGMIKAGVTSDYVYILRAEHLSYQRKYNLILDQNPLLTADNAKIVIDTFKDRWLEKHEYQILEPVEVDIEKRLQESDRFQRNAKIGEDAQYEVFFISGSFLRRNKETFSVVYLGEGSIVATIFKQWVYWYESGSILSDKYVYRRSIDGQRVEKLDWLSNEKTMEVLGESAHYVSEDCVRKMTSDSKTLVIEVFRKTKNETYSITVSDIDGDLNVNKTFPWVRNAEKKMENIHSSVDTTNGTMRNNVKSLLSNNPFFLLEVLPTDNRHSIISKAEEKAFFSAGNEHEEARTKLLNPEKRLAAELDWFCGLSVEQIVDINNCIAGTRKIRTDSLSGIAKLNAVLHNFEVSRYDDYFELGYVILEIDELYNSVDLLVLLKNINNCRQQAGIREVSEDELRRGYTRKRDHIRQLISEKTTQLSKKDYIEFITMVAEKCIANADYNDGIVISDIIDQYEIKMQASIEEAADEIFSHIEGIKNYSNDDAIEKGIDSLIHCVERWDRLVQPLQLKSMASGVTHNGSEEIGRELHQFSVWLHNEKGLSEESLRLINAIKPIFAEIGDLAALFDSDSDTLSNIIKGDKDAKQVVAEVDALKTRADNLKAYSTSTKVDEFIEKVKDINRKVRRSLMDDGLIVQLRESICYIARDVAITLHNNKEQTEYALRITKMLVAEFGDLEELKAKLSQDMSTLTQQILAKERIRRQQEAQEQAEKAKRIGCLVWIGIILLISLISGGLSECNSSGNSEPYVFSQSAESGDDVYVDIVSIEPEYSISTEGSYTSTDVACRCKTSDGKTVWVYMSVYQYNKYIDPDAKLSNSYSAEFETVRYSPAKRIHGEARKAEVLCDGLSEKTGTMVLEFESIG